MEPVRATIALLPLALYLLALAWINLSRRPFVTTGARDFGALGIALVGLVLVGPAELLMPLGFVAHWGPVAWVLVLGLYGSLWTLLSLLMPPKLVVYNVSPTQLRAILAQTALEVDSEAQMTGQTLVLPSRRVELHLDVFPAMRNVTLAPSGRRQSFAGWHDLHRALARNLREVAVPRNPYGITLLVLSLAILVVLAVHWYQRPHVIARNFAEMMGLL